MLLICLAQSDLCHIVFTPQQLPKSFSNQLYNKNININAKTMRMNEWSYIHIHYNDVIMGAIASQITSLTIVYSMVYSGPDQRKHESSVSLAFVREIHRGPVNSPHKWPVTRKKFAFDDIIMSYIHIYRANADKIREILCLPCLYHLHLCPEAIH